MSTLRLSASVFALDAPVWQELSKHDLSGRQHLFYVPHAKATLETEWPRHLQSLHRIRTCNIRNVLELGE
jgi:hypothetical protein